MKPCCPGVSLEAGSKKADDVIQGTPIKFVGEGGTPTNMIKILPYEKKMDKHLYIHLIVQGEK